MTDSGYEMMIYALGNNKISDPIIAVIHAEGHNGFVQSCVQQEPDLTITDLEGTAHTETTVKLEWAKPSYDVVEHYYICWSVVKQHNNHCVVVDRDITEAQVDNLTPGEMYRFSVTSRVPVLCNLKDMESESIFVRTKPGKPGIIDERQVRSTSVVLQWAAPSGKVDSYKTFLSSPARHLEKFEHQDSSLFIDYLEPNTLYHITVYALSDGMESEPRSVEVRTTKGDPGFTESLDVTGLIIIILCLFICCRK